MVGIKEIGVITFSYDNAEMFNDVSLLSAYMAKSWAGTESPIDEFTITSDEEELYNICAKQALPNIYEVLMKMSSGIEDAFKDSVTVETDETEGLKRKAGKYIEININNKGDYNVNALGIVDSTLRDCIKYAVLAEYYSFCLNKDLHAIAMGKYSESLLLLNKRLFQLKKKAVGRVY